MENKISQEMTVLKFFKERKRMCKAHDACVECEAYEKEEGICRVVSELNEYCDNEEYEKLKEVTALVERWSKEHPARTMADVLFETFPDAKRRKEDGTPLVCPQAVVKYFVCHGGCRKCIKEFWNSGVPEK